MKTKNTTLVRYSLSELEQMCERGEDDSLPDPPRGESLGADFWKKAKVVLPPGKTSVHLRLDSDIVEWFRDEGKGHLTRMNAVLRSYMEAHKHSA